MKTYGGQRAVATILRILGIIVGVITVLLAIGACLLYSAVGDMVSNYYDTNAGIIVGIIVGFIILIYGGITSMLVYGAGEAINLLADIAMSTRETTELLRYASGVK